VIVCGIGIDLVHMPRLRAAIERWQGRFLHRVFTPGEIAYCQARRDPVPHFAARFAAKEAGLKALGTGLRLGIRWQELEVQRERGQAPVLLLSGRSREIGRSRGGDRMLLALTHDGEYAMAQALLLSSEGGIAPLPTPPPRKDCGGEAAARNAPSRGGRRRKRSGRTSR
jgi:holo-[acyl-carrier protein] synthase